MPAPVRSTRSRRSRRSLRRGFSIIELMIVFMVFAIVVAIGVPRFNYMRQSSNVRSAKSQVGAALATARATAIRRGMATEVRRTLNRVTVVSGTDTIIRTMMLDTLFRVTLEPAPAVVRYDARGLASLDSSVKFVFTRNDHRDSICVTRIGAVMRDGCL